jgi:hypothetical protein
MRFFRANIVCDLPWPLATVHCAAQQAAAALK